jgi:hypothetical protein
MQDVFTRCGVAAVTVATSTVATLAVSAFLSLAPATAQAGGYPAPAYASGTIALSCDNGRLYPFRVRSVSDFGEIVTGSLFIRPRNAVHMRLIPMGDGYRYAGRGVWFDGKHETAILYFGNHNGVNCTILRDEGAPISVRS